MVTALDVARYFIARSNSDDDGISNMKLQKLVYYAQGFHLAIQETPLFDEPLEAWIHGPVCPELYHAYKGFGKGPIDDTAAIDVTRFSQEQIELLDEVYFVYGQFSAWKLRDLTHQEEPWKNHENDRGIISHDEMRAYFKTRLN